MQKLDPRLRPHVSHACGDAADKALPGPTADWSRCTPCDPTNGGLEVGRREAQGRRQSTFPAVLSPITSVSFFASNPEEMEPD